MSDTTVSRLEERKAREKKGVLDLEEDAELAGNLEHLLLEAQPRLARLASAYGVSPDGVPDVVQETLVTAWQQLAFLHAPDRFEIWLNGICRNLSRRWTHARGLIDRRQSILSSLQPRQESDGEGSAVDPPDPDTLDLAEELNRQDLAVLLDRALGHLPAPTRKAVELYYLADLPQREVAAQLGLTINALEVRLHRARHQLRNVLTNDLRAEAESFGLTLDRETDGREWRQTGIWCFICGRRRLEGIFEPQPSGEVGLRLRCPDCSARTGIDLVNTGAIFSLAERRSFRPAFKRALQALPPFYSQALVTGSQPCPICKNVALLRGIDPEDLPAPFSRRFGLTLDCPVCGSITASIFVCCLAYPPALQFIQQHEHVILEPEELIEFEGQSALRATFIDLMSTARLTLIVHRHTLALLALFHM